MIQYIKNKFSTVYTQNPFFTASSKLSAFNKSKHGIQNTQTEALKNYPSEEYLHPYLIDRVEPSVEHIIFSSYIKF